MDFAILLVVAVIFAGVYMNREHKNDHKYRSLVFKSMFSEGKAVFTHMGGRSEVFDVEGAELMCIGGDVDDPASTWQLNAEVSDKWFVSHTLTGKVYVRCNVGQLIHYDERWRRKSEDFSSSENAEDFWQEFHSADIAFKNKKPASVICRHVRFKNGKWTEVASWSAKFNETPLLEKYDGSPRQPLAKK